MIKKSFLFIIAITYILLLTGCIFENQEVSITFKNETEDVCTEIYIKPSYSSNWGSSIISIYEKLDPGDYYHHTELKDKYDFRFVFESSYDALIEEVDLNYYDEYRINITEE